MTHVNKALIILYHTGIYNHLPEDEPSGGGGLKNKIKRAKLKSKILI